MYLEREERVTSDEQEDGVCKELGPCNRKGFSNDRFWTGTVEEIGTEPRH